MCEEKSDKQTKADACVKIIRSRIMQDREYFQELYKLFSKSEEAKDQGLQRLYSYSLFNCFDQIGYFDAEEIDSIVYVKSENQLEPGDFVKVKIDKALEYDLMGDVINELA